MAVRDFRSVPRSVPEALMEQRVWIGETVRLLERGALTADEVSTRLQRIGDLNLLAAVLYQRRKALPQQAA